MSSVLRSLRPGLVMAAVLATWSPGASAADAPAGIEVDDALKIAEQTEV